MEKFVVGQVVIVRFQFSDLSGEKLRPALVVAMSEFDNLILCQITSKPYSSKKVMKIVAKDFALGGLPISSYVRPDKLFTADASIIVKPAGVLNPAKTQQILSSVQQLFIVS